MVTLTFRTDAPEAELALYEDDTILRRDAWQAHRQLAETIQLHIDSLLEAEHKQLTDVSAIAVYQGPGSFTGLRIGLSVANALAYGLGIPIVGTTGADWQMQALRKLGKGANDQQVVPEYGAPVHITLPKR